MPEEERKLKIPPEEFLKAKGLLEEKVVISPDEFLRSKGLLAESDESVETGAPQETQQQQESSFLQRLANTEIPLSGMIESALPTVPLPFISRGLMRQATGEQPIQENYTIGDITRAIPEVAQAIPATAGALFGGRFAGAKGATVGGALGSGVGSELKQAIRSTSPELFGTESTSLIPPELTGSETASDVIVDLALGGSVLAKNALKNIGGFKQAFGEALRRRTKVEFEPSVKKAYQALEKESPELAAKIPQPTVGTPVSGTKNRFDIVEQLLGEKKLNQKILQDRRNTTEILEKVGQVPRQELVQDIISDESVVKAFNNSAFRKDVSKSLTKKVGEKVLPSEMRFVQSSVLADKNFRHLKTRASNLYEDIKNIFGREEPIRVPLETLESLQLLKARVDKSFELGTPELQKDLNKLKKELSSFTELAEGSQQLPVFNYDQLKNIRTAIEHELPRTANVNFGDINLKGISEDIKSSINTAFQNHPNGKQLLELQERANSLTRYRYQVYPKEIEKSLGQTADHYWSTVFSDPETAKTAIRSVGNPKFFRNEAMHRLFQMPSVLDETTGLINPKQALKQWRQNEGLQAVFSSKQRATVDNFLTVASAVDRTIGEVGQTSMAFQGGRVLINIGAGTFGLLTGGATGALTYGAAPIVLYTSLKNFTEKVLLDPVAGRAATGLLKDRPATKAADDALKQILPKLQGVKVLMQTPRNDGTIDYQEIEIPQLRARGFR